VEEIEGNIPHQPDIKENTASIESVKRAVGAEFVTGFGSGRLSPSATVPGVA
jgi:hypothetical protein